MYSPAFLARVGIGIAASAVEQAAAVPARTLGALASLPTVPVKIAGAAAQSYLHTGQAITELAIKGDNVLETMFPARREQPTWVTFDEDYDDTDQEPGPQ